MGNGALPNGPSYRAHPRLYPEPTSRDVRYLVAIEGKADKWLTLSKDRLTLRRHSDNPSFSNWVRHGRKHELVGMPLLPTYKSDAS
jgi:hypothetical protein